MTPGQVRETFATKEVGAWKVSADDKYVYWLTGTSGPTPSAIRRCSLGGCQNAPESIVQDQSSPSSLVVTDQAIYWTEFGSGMVKGLAK